MNRADDASRLLLGVTAIWHVGPSLHPHESEVGYTMIDAAVAESHRPGSNFQHFIYSSVLQTQLRKLMNHDAKRYVEEYLTESGLNFTILQPSSFLNGFFSMLTFGDQPTFMAPFDLQAFFFSIYEDYGEAAAKVFQEREKHYFAQYPLVSTYPTHYENVVEAASRTLGKEIRIERLSFERAVGVMTQVRGGGSPNPRVQDGLERILVYYNRRGLVGNPTITEWLLGRKPTTVEHVMESVLKA
ncbi:hypothetical protein N7451_012720 [Penicillium sp. IBT 35674x]|nr:hypothetical protein N7451_012720 [Penicillium sp. IBT 35674x]